MAISVEHQARGLDAKECCDAALAAAGGGKGGGKKELANAMLTGGAKQLNAALTAAQEYFTTKLA